MNRKAFSFFELLVVIALCGLIATLGVMQFSFFDAVIVHVEIEKLATACNYLQQKAIATNQECTMRFDIQNNAYYVDKICEKLSKNIVFGFSSQVLGPPGSPSTAITKAITFADSVIHFYPTGIISAGTIYLIDKKKQSMYALSNAVSQVSFLRLYCYEQKWKLLGD